MKKIIVVAFMICFLYGCSGEVENSQDVVEEDLKTTEDIQEPQSEEMEHDLESSDSAPVRISDKEVPLWHKIQLEDVNSDKVYTIEELNDKPILLESFAVWCPKCTQQQREIKKFHDEVGDAVISIGLNTDPNEDENVVLEHAKKNDFDWIYSISPTDLTKELLKEFGREVVSAPSVPIVLICEDGKSYLLDRGFKSTEKLKNYINEKCNQNI